jgi:hypothetical protein
LELSKKFVETIKKEKLPYDFNIYFVHFEIHIEYTHQLTTSEKLENNLKEKEKEKDNNSKMILELKNNLKETNDRLYEMERKEKLRKNKKKIQRDFENLIYEEIEKYKNIIKKEDLLIVTKFQFPDYKCSREVNNKLKYKNIFDFRTFCLIYYKEENKDLIDDVKAMHLNNIKKY